MSGGDFFWFFCIWLISNGVLGTIAGYSEKFRFELQGCQPDIASWLRYGILQYMIIIFLIVYLNCIPRQYSGYFWRFLNNGLTTFALLFVFVVMQVLSPWITLMLYLRLRQNCSERITSRQAVFYWIMFAIQVLVFLVGSVIMYFFFGILREIFHEYKDKRSVKIYSQRVAKLLHLHQIQNIRVLYSELLQGDLMFQVKLFVGDLQMLRLIRCRKIDSKCAETLSSQHRICFRCKGPFELGDRVHFMEVCCHIAHWECFMSVFAHNGQCSECKQLSVHALKKSIAYCLVHDLHQLVAVPPSTQPAFQEQSRPEVAPLIHILWVVVTIEYFNYTVDQKTGGEPAEALPAPVAETEI